MNIVDFGTAIYSVPRTLLYKLNDRSPWLRNDNILNVVLPRFENKTQVYGKGSIRGHTYKNDASTIIECNVDAVYNGDIIASTQTTAGEYSLDYLSTELKYTVVCTPLSGEYKTHSIHDITPINNVELYAFKIYAIYDRVAYNGYTFNVQVTDSIGDIIYTLVNAPLGVTVDEYGHVLITQAPKGLLTFTINVSMVAVSITKTVDVSIYITA